MAVFAPAGFTDLVMAVVRQCRDGMRARIPMDDGEPLEVSEVTQGLRRDRVLSPLLFDIFSTAALEIVLVRFRGDVISLANISYGHGKGGPGHRWNSCRKWRGLCYIPRFWPSSPPLT